MDGGLFVTSDTRQTTFLIGRQVTGQHTNGYGQEITTLKTEIIDKVKNGYAKVTQAFAPFIDAVNDSIKYSTLYLEPDEADFVPESGMVRNMGIQWFTQYQIIQRRGRGFRVSRMLLDSEQGPAKWEMLMYGLAETIAHTVDSDCLIQLMYQKSNFDTIIMNLPSTDQNSRIIKRDMERKLKYWANVATNRPLREFNRYAHMQIGGETKDHVLVLDYRTADMMNNSQYMLEFFRSGGVGELMLNLGTDALTITGALPTGEPVIVIKGHKTIFEDPDIRRSVLERVSQIGDFFCVEAPKLGDRSGLEYESQQMDVRIYDEATDRFEIVKFIDMLWYSGRFDKKDGTLIGGNFEEDSEKSRVVDLSTMRVENDDPFDFRYKINDLLEDPIEINDNFDDGKTYLRPASLCGNVATDPKYFLHLAKSIIRQYTISRRMPEQKFFSIWTDGMESYERLGKQPYTAAFGDKFQASLTVNGLNLNSEGTSIVLPSLVNDAGAFVAKNVIPFGYASLGGMKEIARHAENAEEMGYDKVFFVKVSKFVNLFKDFVDYLTRVFPEHPLLDTRNIPPHSYGKTPEYALFPNLFASSREFNLFLSRDPRAPRDDLEAREEELRRALTEVVNARKDALGGINDEGKRIRNIDDNDIRTMDNDGAIRYWRGKPADFLTEEDNPGIDENEQAEARNVRNRVYGAYRTRAIRNPALALINFLENIPDAGHGLSEHMDSYYGRSGISFVDFIQRIPSVTVTEQQIILFHHLKRKHSDNEDGYITNTLSRLANVRTSDKDKFSIAECMKKWGINQEYTVKTKPIFMAVKKNAEKSIEAWMKLKKGLENRSSPYPENIDQYVRTPNTWTPELFKSLLTDQGADKKILPSRPDTPFIPYLDDQNPAIEELEKNDEYAEYYSRLTDGSESTKDLFKNQDLNRIKQTRSISTQFKYPAVHSEKMYIDGKYNRPSVDLDKREENDNGDDWISLPTNRAKSVFIGAKNTTGFFSSGSGGSSSSRVNRNRPTQRGRGTGTIDSVNRTLRMIESTLPAQRDHDYFYDTLSERFMNVNHDIWVSVSNSLEKALSSFSTFVLTNYSQTVKLLEENLPTVFEAYGFRPWKDYRSVSVIKAPTNLGRTYTRDLEMNITADGNADVQVSALLDYKSVFNRNLDKVYVMEDAHVLEMLRGGSTGFFEGDAGITNFDKMGSHKGSSSIISHLVPYGSISDEPQMDITGKYNYCGQELDRRVFPQNEKAHYLGSEFFRYRFFENIPRNGWMTNLQFNPYQNLQSNAPIQARCNTVVNRTTYLRYRGDGKEDVFLGNCHWNFRRTLPGASEQRYNGGIINAEFWTTNPNFVVAC